MIKVSTYTLIFWLEMIGSTIPYPLASPRGVAGDRADDWSARPPNQILDFGSWSGIFLILCSDEC